jgi:hypothetical protein
VKRILLIEDGRPFWPRVRDLLAKVNAVVEEGGPDTPAPAAGEARPDLVVVGDTVHAGRPRGWWSGPLLVLVKGREPDFVSPLGDGERRMAAASSIDERSFLALTSRMLGVSERRLFRAVIGVKRAGSDHLHMGASREFSLTGLSFSLAAPLEPNERVLVSFYIPSARRRVRFEAQVVRAFPDPEGGPQCYGARFVGLSGEEQEDLKRFVWGEA